MKRSVSRLQRSLGVATVATLAASFSIEAFAQMDEIVVTTRKREENLQDVPIAVGVLGAEELRRRGIVDAQDVAKFSPSVQFDQGFSPQDTRIVIRGLSPSRGRNNVAVLLDGIDVTSQAIQSNGGSLFINPRLFDAERVEVVKGPQMALYGRSAFAGAINYVSKKPTEEFEATAGLEIGSDNMFELNASVGGGLIAGNVLNGRVDVATWSRDGYHTNSVTGEKIGDQDGVGVAASLVWNPTESIQLVPRIDWTSDEFGASPYATQDPVFGRPIPPSAVAGGVVASCNPVPFPGCNPDPFLGPTPQAPDGDDLPVRLSENPRTGNDYSGTERDILRFSLNASWELDPVTLTYLGSIGTMDTFQFEDANRVGSLSDKQAGGEIWFDEERELQSHELRVQSNGEGSLNWTAGALFWEEDTEFRDGSITCLQQSGFLQPDVFCDSVLAAFDNGPGSNPRNPYLWEQDTESFSIYGLIEWRFLEDWVVVAEGRYTDEELTVSGPSGGTTFGGTRIVDPTCGLPGAFCFFPLPPTVPPQDGVSVASIKGSTDDQFFKDLGYDDGMDFFTPKVTLQWDASDDMMYYVSWSQAQKPAGIAAQNAGVGPFDPALQAFDSEEMTVYEFGGKTSWLNDTLLLNGALFYQDYDEKQLSTQTVDPVSGLPTTRAINAAEASVLGLEIEATWLATDNLTLSAAYTYLDTEYDELKPLSGSASQITAAGNCTVVDTPGTAPGTDPTCQLDLSGNALEDAPDHSLVGFAGYRAPLTGETDWLVEADILFEDSRFESSSADVEWDSYWLFNLRAGISNAQWDIIAYIDNVTDDDTIRSGFRNPDARFIASGFPYNGTYLRPDPRTFGVRLNYAFGAR